MFPEYLAHELAKERMYTAIRDARRARRRAPIRHRSYVGLWSALWRGTTRLWQSFGHSAEGRVALKRR
jgi:hypothetical protein